MMIIDLYGMFSVWTDTRNTAARNAVMLGLIEFNIHPTAEPALWVCNSSLLISLQSKSNLGASAVDFL